MSVRGVRVDIGCHGVAAAVDVTVLVVGEETAPTEVAYRHSFSGVDGPAAVCGLRVRRQDGQEYVGKVVARDEAQNEFEDAVAQGHQPCLVETVENARAAYTMSLGVVRPGEVLVAQLQCAVTVGVNAERNGVEVQLPVAMFPIVEKCDADGTREEVAGWDGRAVRWGKMDICCEWHDADLCMPPRSDTHAVGERGPHGWPLGVRDAAFETGAYVHLFAEMANEAKTPLAVRGARCASGALVCAAHAIECTEGAQAEFVFLADVSGSMRGERVEYLKQALTMCVKTMGRRIPFDICLFSYDTTPLSEMVETYRVPGAKKCETEKEVEEILAAIDEIDAEGGTNLMSALEYLQITPLSAGCSGRVVFVMTDGMVNDNARVKACMETGAWKNHLFVGLGLGKQADRQAVRMLGRDSMYAFVHKASALARATMGLLGKTMGGEVLREVRASDGWRAHDPSQGVAFAAGSTAVFWSIDPAFTKGDECPEAQVLAESSSHGTIIAPVTHFHEDNADRGRLAKLIAAARVEELKRAGNPSVGVAEEAGIVTNDTSLLLVVTEDAEPLTKAPALRNVDTIVIGSSAFDDDPELQSGKSNCSSCWGPPTTPTLSRGFGFGFDPRDTSSGSRPSGFGVRPDTSKIENRGSGGFGNRGGGGFGNRGGGGFGFGSRGPSSPPQSGGFGMRYGTGNFEDRGGGGFGNRGGFGSDHTLDIPETRAPSSSEGLRYSGDGGFVPSTGFGSGGQDGESRSKGFFATCFGGGGNAPTFVDKTKSGFGHRKVHVPQTGSYAFGRSRGRGRGRGGSHAATPRPQVHWETDVPKDMLVHIMNAIRSNDMWSAEGAVEILAALGVPQDVLDTFSKEINAIDATHLVLNILEYNFPGRRNEWRIMADTATRAAGGGGMGSECVQEIFATVKPYVHTPMQAFIGHV